MRGEECRHDGTGAALHHVDGSAAIAARAQCGQLGATRGRDLRGRDVRHERRVAQDSDVDDEDLMALRTKPITHVRVLVTFRIERPDEQHGAIGHHSALPALVPPAARIDAHGSSADMIVPGVKR